LDLLPDQTGSTGLMWKLDIKPFLSDIDTNTTLLKIYTESEDLSGLEVIVAGSELVFFSTQAGVGTLRVYVSDGENTVERSVNVTVTKSDAPQDSSNAWMYILILLAIVIIVLLVLLIVAKRAYFGAYTIEEAFIVDKHGMCLAHRSRRGGEKVDSDEDIFTGMLTVVQQFVKDSFKQKKSKEGQEEYLNMFKFGDTTVLIEPGKLVFVAVFFRGSPGKRLEARLKKFITDLEFKHASSIKGWGGNTRSIAALSDELVKLVGK
jgi:hypothetical protein